MQLLSCLPFSFAISFGLIITICHAAAEERRIHSGWKACRLSRAILDKPALGCRHHHHHHHDKDDGNALVVWNVTQLPTTALAVLLQQEQIPGLEHLRMDDLYTSTNMATIPDIATVGRAFYTLVYELDLTTATMTGATSAAAAASCNDKTSVAARRTILRFAGINYRADAYLDGQRLPEIGSLLLHGSNATNGMFRRRSYDVTCGRKFHIIIEPPLHPGTCQEKSTSTTTTTCTGQGGNHALAKDGATAQYMLGWDWAQSMPDRATGFYGAVTLETTYDNRAGIVLRDAAVHTVSLQNCTNTTRFNDSPIQLDALSFFACRHIVLRVKVRVECICCQATSRQASRSNHRFCPHASTITKKGKLEVTAGWGEAWTLDNITWDDDGTADIAGRLTVQRLDRVKLWWPHGMVKPGDEAVLYPFWFSLKAHDGKTTLDEIQIKVGIRTIETHLDANLQGQTFYINGQRLYLVGGNWISPDQALRYSASVERYCQELALHKHAGLNLIRVWGGGTAERDDFYACADELGLLVYQEFWMTGDNNGRWAGNYTWPLNHDAYLANVKDTILRLRGHASLLFYGGCNECLAPSGLDNPPRDINEGIQLIIERYDPGRFYVSSSMSGANVADTFERPEQWYNRSYSLAFADGPYGLLMPPSFFERNPGLGFKNVSIGFQPEIGSTAAPTLSGLLRFMTVSEAERGFPRRSEPDVVGEAWDFHRFQGWSTVLPENDSKIYDHVYAYFAPDQVVTVKDWCAAAQLTAHSQYQTLFEGYISHVFEYTTAVIMWKTQSPWPALRGFLYDWYLEATGALRGVRAALGDSISIALDASTWQLRIVNRSIYPLYSKVSPGFRVGASFMWITLQGDTVHSGNVWLRNNVAVAPMSAVLLGSAGSDVLKWPNKCTVSGVCFLSLKPILPSTWDHFAHSHSSWHWLTNPSSDMRGRLGSDFSALGTMRQRRAGHGSLTVESCLVADTVIEIQASILVDSIEPLFYPTWALRMVTELTNIPVLPIFDENESEAVLLPGMLYNRTISARAGGIVPADGPGFHLRVVIESWNGPAISVTTICGRKQGNARYFGVEI